jgi:hypothetical protein
MRLVEPVGTSQRSTLLMHPSLKPPKRMFPIAMERSGLPLRTLWFVIADPSARHAVAAASPTGVEEWWYVKERRTAVSHRLKNP